ncbi:Hypothetical protein A7982_10573 [Minicystis rosea]|nr:Hypothetical protein A7982_10573 [Minicystis rosea]
MRLDAIEVPRVEQGSPALRSSRFAAMVPRISLHQARIG